MSTPDDRGYDYPRIARALILGDRETVGRMTREGGECCTAVFEHGAQVVGMSALRTTTMPAMKRTIDVLEKAGLRAGVKVMIGGAPVSQAFADEIGADGYARDSTLAVVKAKELLGATAVTS